MRNFPISIALALVAAVAPAAAAAPARVSAKPQVVDPSGDANLLNDQHNAYLVGGPHTGDVTAPGNVEDQGDILAVWFTNDARTLTAHIQTTAPPAEDAGLVFGVDTNRHYEPDGIHHGCTFFQIFLVDGAEGNVWDYCITGERVPAEVRVETLTDGTGHVTITAPRTFVPFIKGMVLEEPHADSRMLVIEQTGHYLGFLDTTAEGSDYRIKG